MLIEAALHQARTAQAAWGENRAPDATAALGRCRDILAELIAGIQPEQTPVAKQVLGVYLFLFSALIEAQFAHDSHQLAGVIRVLEEERETWQRICEQWPERPVAEAPPGEELAPQRVAGALAATYAPPAAVAPQSAAATFSIDA
jgi:flagellar protein FliS